MDEKQATVPAEVGEVPIRIVRPLNSTGPLPTILYVQIKGRPCL